MTVETIQKPAMNGQRETVLALEIEIRHLMLPIQRESEGLFQLIGKPIRFVQPTL